MKEEHYEAQKKYTDMLFEFLEISRWRHPIKSFRALAKAEYFRNTHKDCCGWANEEV